jgi:hypothetical protein
LGQRATPISILALPPLALRKCLGEKPEEHLPAPRAERVKSRPGKRRSRLRFRGYFSVAGFASRRLTI